MLDPRERHDFARLGDLADTVRIKRGGPFMHLKAYEIDGATLRTGSANFSSSGENAQDNDLIVIRDGGGSATRSRRISSECGGRRPDDRVRPGDRRAGAALARLLQDRRAGAQSRHGGRRQTNRRSRRNPLRRRGPDRRSRSIGSLEALLLKWIGVPENTIITSPLRRRDMTISSRHAGLADVKARWKRLRFFGRTANSRRRTKLSQIPGG